MLLSLNTSTGETDTYYNKLNQERYLETALESSVNRKGRVLSIADELGTMHEKCRFSVCIPAYQEASIIVNTLENYTLLQRCLN